MAKAPKTELTLYGTSDVGVCPTKEGEKSSVPSKVHPNDAGYDLTCSQNTVVSIGARAMVPTNISLQIPPHLFALILPRSSAFYKKGLIIHPGTVDPDYRGEVKVLVWNPTTKAVYLSEGDSIAQLVFVPRIDAVFNIKPLEESGRGQNGFGSTGRVPTDRPLGDLQP